MDTEEAKLCVLYLRSLREEKFLDVKHLAFFYDSYEPRCWVFETFESFTRLILIGGMVFLRPGTASQIVNIHDHLSVLHSCLRLLSHLH